MTILLFPIFLFGVVISWIVYLGVQQANECALAMQRVRAQQRPPEQLEADEVRRNLARHR